MSDNGGLADRFRYFARGSAVNCQSPPVLKTTELDSSTVAHPHTHEGNRLPALYRKFGPLIYSRCRRALHDDELALKATQEVFVQVLRALDDQLERGAVEALSSACEKVCLELRAR